MGNFQAQNIFLEVMQQTLAPVATFQKCTEAQTVDEGQVEEICLFALITSVSSRSFNECVDVGFTIGIFQFCNLSQLWLL